MAATATKTKSQKRPAKRHGTTPGAPAPSQAKKGKGGGLPLSTTLESMLVDGSDSEFRLLMYNFLVTSALMLKAREKFAAYIGVTAPQYSIMASIGEVGPSTVGQIATRLRVSSPFATAEINKLIRKGIVAKEPHELDGRSIVVHLTEKGVKLIHKVSPMRQFANDKIFEVLSTEQAIQFIEITKQLVVSFEECLHELNAPKWTRPAKEIPT